MSSVDRLTEPYRTNSERRVRRFGRSDDADGRRPPDLALTVGVYLAILASLFPLARVVTPSMWTVGILALPAVLLGVGYLARRYRIPAVGVSLIETAVWALLLTPIFFAGTAFLILPMPATFEAAADLIRGASDQIVNGAAPLDAGIPLTFLLVAAAGLLTIAIDHVVLTARMPLLAAIGLIVVSLIPSIAVPSDVDLLAFVLLAATVLYLLRAETRSREDRGAPTRSGSSGNGRTLSRGSGVAAAATGIGVVAVIVALVAAPLFPALSTSASGPGGRWNSIDPTLQLGKDLRRPNDGEVLKLRTDASSAPYLRAATLSSFDGKIWRPDTGRAISLDDAGALGDITVDKGVRVIRYTSTVDVSNLVSGWLPVAYPAVTVTGLQGQWAVLPSNRTIQSTSTSANGQHYEVVADVPRPSLEQIRASNAHSDVLQDTAKTLPIGLPSIVTTLAAQVTVDATTDYDRLIALQSWFRSSQFKYSLEAPVEAGFDGTGVEAVAKFLKVRSGYCIHFASAFALMARTLGMSSRIVVGYLPGQGSTDSLTRSTVYTVMSSQLHAWPEVYFTGIGWVPFEPTNSLGTATAFSPAASADVDTGGKDVGPTPTVSSTPEPTASARPENLRDDDASATDASGTIVRPLPWLASVLALFIVLAVPGAVRAFRRRELLGAARAGDAASAWRSLQDTAVDLAIPEPSGESPRAFGARMVAQYGAPADSMGVLVTAIERASYAPNGRGRYGPDLADALTAVRDGMLAHAERPRRIMALVLPRSLVIRPGSAYAAGGDALRTAARR